MPKDESPVSYIEEFNRSHRRIKREEKDWYVLYLPRGLGMEDITEKEDRELMANFTTAEEEMEIEFDMMVRERFLGYFESLTMVDLIEYLPQKPVPLMLENLKREDRNAIKEIYDEGVGSGYIKKTIRKQIRKHLQEKGYLKKGEMKVAKEAEEESKKDKRKMEKKVLRKKQVREVDIGAFLPQKPFVVSLADLQPDDEKYVIEIYQSGTEAGYVRKTIRKQIRRYLEDKGYFESIENIVEEKIVKDNTQKDKKVNKKIAGKKAEREMMGKEIGKHVKSPKKRKKKGKGKETPIKGAKKTSDRIGKKQKGAAQKGEEKPSPRIVSGEDIEDYLPQKPEPITLNTLKKNDRRSVEEIFRTGMDDNHVKKTIRKHIRLYLGNQGYLTPDEMKKSGKKSGVKIKGEAKKSGEASKRPKGGSKPTKRKKKKVPKKETKPMKGNEEPIDYDQYLPNKPKPIAFKKLKKKEKAEVEDICRKGIAEGFVQKTIRKQLRKYLAEKGHLD